ncbi:hypothetical protein COLO4_28808 [Corchorus olitorius]|uniref:Uncharacterized protein n=1 Tax=Corchorus olitorius TaxID=93759 RepID=A0A1R3HID8_9ROSI|nr:hypothetical protein COLO4_28808 [Corchorus olitorius]
MEIWNRVGSAIEAVLEGKSSDCCLRFGNRVGFSQDLSQAKEASTKANRSEEVQKSIKVTGWAPSPLGEHPTAICHPPTCCQASADAHGRISQVLRRISQVPGRTGGIEERFVAEVTRQWAAWIILAALATITILATTGTLNIKEAYTVVSFIGGSVLTMCGNSVPGFFKNARYICIEDL